MLSKAHVAKQARTFTERMHYIPTAFGAVVVLHQRILLASSILSGTHHRSTTMRRKRIIGKGSENAFETSNIFSAHIPQ
jgi:hypothetical protein